MDRYKLAHSENGEKFIAVRQSPSGEFVRFDDVQPLLALLKLGVRLVPEHGVDCRGDAWMCCAEKAWHDEARSRLEDLGPLIDEGAPRSGKPAPEPVNKPR